MSGKPGIRLGLAMLGGLAALALGAPQRAEAQLFLYEPDFASSPIAADDPMVGVAIPGATAAEYRAHLLWNLRSGLNVAALQCQFSPYLRAVSNYNDILAHHSRELASAYTTLEGYFRRVHGRTGPRQFDDYSTQTYNNFSTLQAQLGFCDTAGEIARAALATRKGELHQLAVARMRELRSSLVPYNERLGFTRPQPLAPVAFDLRVDCSRLARRERRACERQQSG